MEDKGWKLSLIPENEGPGFQMDTPDGQRDAEIADMQGCQKQAGDHPFQELTESSAHQLYAEAVKRAKCLSGMGYDIQPPPSEAKWVAQQLAQDPKDDLWDPYDDVPDVGPAEWTQITTACPQTSLWGD